MRQDKKQVAIRNRYVGGLFWCLGACVLWSLSGLYSRLIDVDIPTAIVVRNSVCGLFFVGLQFLLPWRLHSKASDTPMGVTLFAGVLGTISSMGYIGALLLAPIANVVVIYATTPIFAILIAWQTMGTGTSGSTILRIFCALIGVIVVFSDGLQSFDALWGNSLAVIMTAATAGLMVLMQRYPSINSITVTLFICLISVSTAMPFATLGGLNLSDVVLLGAYGLSGGVAFVFLMLGVRNLTSVEAGLISTLEVVLAPTWVYFAFDEIPTQRVFVGGAIVLIAVGAHFYSKIYAQRIPSV